MNWLRLLKAIVILFGMVLLVFLIFVWSVNAVSFDYSGITMPDKQMCKDTKNVLDGLKKPDIDAASSAASTFLSPRKVEMTVESTGNAAVHESSVSSPFITHQYASSPESRMYYFISFSMPQGILEDAFKDAVRLRKEGVNVVLILRGFVRNDLKSTIRRLYSFIKESGLDNSDLPVELHPQLFSDYSVTSVPVVVYESDIGTGRISGVSLAHALSRFRKDVKDYGKHGTTYQIEEEDLLNVIETRLKSPEFEQRVRSMLGKARDNMYRLTKYGGRFSRAEKDRVYRIDPTWTLDMDIADHRGNIIFKKGMAVNPADYVPLTGKYIFIDGNDEKQVSYALNGKFRKIVLTSGDLKELTRSHRQRFFLVNDDLIEKIQLTRVPAILEQDGRYLRVTEKAVN